MDVVTTLAMVAGGGAPGVSSNLSVQYLLPIPAGSSFEIEAAVVRRGRRQVVTEAKIWRSSSAMDDSRLAVVATHTKVVTASQAWAFFFIWHLLPKVLVEFWVRHRGGGSSMNSVTLEQRLSTTPTAPGSQPDEQQAKKVSRRRRCRPSLRPSRLSHEPAADVDRHLCRSTGTGSARAWAGRAASTSGGSTPRSRACGPGA